MRTTTALIIGFGLLTGVAHAQQPTVWQGVAFIIGNNGAPTCASGGEVVGNYFMVVYRPILPAISQSGPEGLTFSSDRTSELFESGSATKSLRGSGTFNSSTIHSWAYSTPNTGPYSLRMTPGTITPTTASVTINGTLGNFYDNEGCTVTIQASLTLRPS